MKVHVCKLRSLFHHLAEDDVFPDVKQENDDEGDDLSAEPLLDSFTIFPDILPISPSFTGIDQRAMLFKQIRCAGVKDWLEEPDFYEPLGAEDRQHVHLRVWIFNTDKGGDQQAASRMIGMDIADKSLCLHFHNYCLLHQLALITKRVLAVLDPHWSKVAKLINVWRGGSHAKRMYSVWEQKFGVDRARACAGSLPARPLRGRWGAISRAEARVLTCTRRELVAVFLAAVVNKPQKASKKATAAEPILILDETAEDYTVRMSRWTAEVVENILEDAFWGDLYISHYCRTPIDHLHNWLQKTTTPKDTDPPPLLTYVCNMVDKIENEICFLFGDKAYDTIWSELFFDVLEGRDIEFWTCRIVMVLLAIAADFRHRNTIPARNFPFLLMWLIYAEPHVPCPERRECGKTMLGPELIGDVSSLKILKLFLKNWRQPPIRGSAHLRCTSSSSILLRDGSCTPKRWRG